MQEFSPVASYPVIAHLLMGLLENDGQVIVIGG